MMAELSTFLVAMSPVVELRGAIPLAIGVYDLPVVLAFVLAVLGNLVPSLSILIFDPISRLATQHIPVARVLLDWLFERTRVRHKEKVARWGQLALLFVVAIPLPFTGVWTASIIAIVFGIPFHKAFPFITGGVIIAGILVTLITLGAISLI